MPRIRQLLLIGLLFCLALPPAAMAGDEFAFDDTPLEALIQHPDWFKNSLLNLDDDLAEAISAGKQGLIVYFGQRRCPYCKMLMDKDFGRSDIEQYTRQHFDVVAIDIWSHEPLTTPEGEQTTARDYSREMETTFTPSLVFFDGDGKVALRLRGYYPPYQFRAALEYVADGHYRRETFPVYLARGDSTLRFEAADLVEEPFFMPPPYNLDRSRFPAERPLVVFFERGDCHACDVLHTQPLQRPAIAKLFQHFDTVQLDMAAETPVITPDGQPSTARQWAEGLGLFYAPSLLFFDENGREVIRVDSVVGFFRLRMVLNYMLTRGYLSYPNFLEWRADSLF